MLRLARSIRCCTRLFSLLKSYYYLRGYIVLCNHADRFFPQAKKLITGIKKRNMASELEKISMNTKETHIMPEGHKSYKRH